MRYVALIVCSFLMVFGILYFRTVDDTIVEGEYWGYSIGDRRTSILKKVVNDKRFENWTFKGTPVGDLQVKVGHEILAAKEIVFDNPSAEWVDYVLFEFESDTLVKVSRYKRNFEAP